MKLKVQGLMQKINYTEQDMELQKQILVTIPSKEKDNIKEVIQNIADLKEKINALKLEIKEIDPDEFNGMMAMEKASDRFKEIAKDKKFEFVKTFGNDGDLAIEMADDKIQNCLVVAKEENGNWVVLTMEGEVLELPNESIKNVKQ
ncbi:MAG: hypothetical protein GY714_01410 [Desulfobacterales bacterium]|nr:hypothetical protein [Desulfobacterales bacterium]MCP4159181.1 hypothetical protein [Deltaproteobacteria bacterium]